MQQHPRAQPAGCFHVQQQLKSIHHLASQASGSPPGPGWRSHACHSDIKAERWLMHAACRSQAGQRSGSAEG